ncbi:hypothetical protein DEO72_LG10g1954 [Vigna unguiculata]|uniref:Uncharacterized protein n=1 Tax=Vigna unguiculata TaxID=3917 RepID=A0A4D6NA55_VIGUN|nr:hypothetical protein DEO72_LG10g1954 [Vigna unguiculata]
MASRWCLRDLWWWRERWHKGEKMVTKQWRAVAICGGSAVSGEEMAAAAMVGGRRGEN